ISLVHFPTWAARLVWIWRAMGSVLLVMSVHCVCAWSWQAHPPRFTFSDGAPVNATPTSKGNDQCPLRGMVLPQPVVIVKAGLVVWRLSRASPLTGVAPVAELALAE